MNAPPLSSQPADARSVYSQRLSTLASEQSRLRRKDRVFGFSKLAFAAIAVVSGIALARTYPTLLAWALVPALIFVALWMAHERLLHALSRATRLEAFYRRGLARLDDTWAGHGDSGERFLDAKHLYARDLDIFGAGSLYERISRAASAPGQHTLADWLLHPAPAAEIAQRQDAVRELTPRLDLREELALAADAIYEGTPAMLTAWAESREASLPQWFPYLALPLGALWLVTFILWAAQGRGGLFALASLASAILTARYYGAVKRAAADILHIAPLLGALSHVLSVFETESFHAPRLAMLTAAVRSNGMLPSRALAKLQRNIEYLESRHNWFVKLVDPFVFWTPLCMYVIEAWRRRHGGHMRAWLASVGEFEALSSLSCFAYERPACCYPTLRSDASATDATFDAKELTHPLLPHATAVANDVLLDAAHPLIIVSGPNMAGKSTLLRAIGLNAVLAQCGAPVCCISLTLSPLVVGASITVQDSLQSGLSRFYAEIQRLKQITDLAGGTEPTLFLLDELLSGTNSHDRRVGTEALLRGLLARNAIGLITTHDLALTEIAGALDREAANVHFGDRFSAGELHFDYKLTAGIADSTNALQLMRSIGLEV